MSVKRRVIGLSFNYRTDQLKDGIYNLTGPSHMENKIRDAFAAVGVETHTVDLVDPSSDETLAVIFFDFNWRHWLHDKYLKTVPFEKRVLVTVEPRNINPTLYYVPFFRRKFKTVFTYDERLLAKNPDYIRHVVISAGELSTFAENRYAHIPFADKKLLCAVNLNRWSYMPQSTYGLRKKAYGWFCDHRPENFDLYGHYWNQPVIFYERWFGYPKFSCYRGAILGDYTKKMDTMARYRFALCFENNADAPGYISEKIRDCFCARCVPIYYGSSGIEKYVPRDCFVNLRDFKSFEDLDRFIAGMTECEHARYVSAIDRYIGSPAAGYLSSKNFTDILVRGLGLK